MGLPVFMGHVVAGVDGEIIGLVGVVHGVGVEGADADLFVGGKVGDGDGLAGGGIGAAVERVGAGSSEFAEGGNPRAGLAVAVCVDEVVLEAAVDGADLGRGGGVGDDAVGRRGEGCAGMGGHGRVRRCGCDRNRGCGGRRVGGRAIAWASVVTWRVAWHADSWRCSRRRAGRRATPRTLARCAWRLGQDGAGQDGEREHEGENEGRDDAQVILEPR